MYTHRRFANCLLLVCALLSTGCYTYHIYQIGGGPEAREKGNQPVTEWFHGNTTLNAFFWGAIRQDMPVENCQDANGVRWGMEEVRVEKNFGHMLAQTLTLGIWVPIRVNWRCNRPVPPTGTLGEQPK